MARLRLEIDMLMALLLAYFLGGGIGGSGLTTAEVKQLSRQAEAIIADSVRAGEARDVFKRLRAEVKSFDKTFRRSGRQLTKSYKNHAADRDQALAILADLNSSWEESQLRALELRFELKDVLTEDEWNALFAGE